MTAGGGAERLAPPGLDLVIVLGAPPVPRERIAGWARQGAWQLSYSDVAVASGSYAGFWEVYQRADHTTVKLWRLGASEDEDELLDQRSFNTEIFWLKNRARAFCLGNFMVRDAAGAGARAPHAAGWHAGHERRAAPGSGGLGRRGVCRPPGLVNG